MSSHAISRTNTRASSRASSRASREGHQRGTSTPSSEKSRSSCASCARSSTACICQICVCSRHRCLPDSLKMNEMSTYYRDFDNKRGAKRSSYAPKMTMPPNLKFDSESTYKTAFDNKPIPKKFVREREKAHSSVPFQGTSTSRADYVTHKVGVRESLGPKSRYTQLRDDRQFDTEQRSQYYTKPGDQGNARCPAVPLVSQQSRRKDGHTFFEQKTTPGGARLWEACSKATTEASGANSLTGYAVGGTHEGHVAETREAELA